MIIFFNKINENTTQLAKNNRLQRLAISTSTVGLNASVTHWGVCNWTGFSGLIVGGVTYPLGAVAGSGVVMGELNSAITSSTVNIGIAGAGGESKVGCIFLGIVFSDFKVGMVESFGYKSTDKTKETLTGASYINNSGVSYRVWNAQCPPILNDVKARSLIDLMIGNNEKNVIIKTEGTELNNLQGNVYAKIELNNVATQGYLRYGTKIKITERY